jgi:molybdopterin converting factor small subunit
MRVSLKLGDPLWRAVGKRELTLDLPDGSSVDDALGALASSYPDAGKEMRLGTTESDFYYSLFVNDRLVLFANRQKSPLRDGDVISVLLPLAGG